MESDKPWTLAGKVWAKPLIFSPPGAQRHCSDRVVCVYLYTHTPNPITTTYSGLHYGHTTQSGETDTHTQLHPRLPLFSKSAYHLSLGICLNPTCKRHRIFGNKPIGSKRQEQKGRPDGGNNNNTHQLSNAAWCMVFSPQHYAILFNSCNNPLRQAVNSLLFHWGNKSQVWGQINCQRLCS